MLPAVGIHLPGAAGDFAEVPGNSEVASHTVGYSAGAGQHSVPADNFVPVVYLGLPVHVQYRMQTGLGFPLWVCSVAYRTSC